MDPLGLIRTLLQMCGEIRLRFASTIFIDSTVAAIDNSWRLPSPRFNYPLNVPWTHHRLPFNMRNAIYAIAHDSRRDFDR